MRIYVSTDSIVIISYKVHVFHLDGANVINEGAVEFYFPEPFRYQDLESAE